MFFSIIVPAFNVQAYIKQCIDSLLTQNIDDYEIIIVDDCSKDYTSAISDTYTGGIVKTIHNEKNLGLSDSRNIGLKSAKGEYIIFVDSDDYIETNILQTIKDRIEELSKPDIVYLGYYLEKGSTSFKKYTFNSGKNAVYDAKEFARNELSRRKIPIPACFAAYRRDYLISNALYFKSGILHEDELWSPITLLTAKSVGTTDICFYHYIIREGSITQRKDNTKNGLDMLDSCNDLIEFTDKSSLDSNLKKLMYNHIAMIYIKAMCRGRLYRKPYCHKVNRTLPYRYSCFLKDKVKGIIFMGSLRMYYYCDKWLGNNI